MSKLLNSFFCLISRVFVLGILSRVLNLFIQIFIIPTSVSYLSIKDSSILIVVLNFQVFLILFDFGTNLFFPSFFISERLSGKDNGEVLRNIYSVLFFIFLIDFFVISVVFYPVEKFVFEQYRSFPFGILFLSSILYLFYIFSTMIFQFYFSIRKLEKVYLIQISGFFLMGLSVFYTMKLSKNIYLTIFVLFFSQSIIPFILTVKLLKEISIFRSRLTQKNFLNFLKSSSSCLFFLISSSVLWGSDTIVIARNLSYGDQIQYSFFLKIFSAFVGLFNLFFQVTRIELSESFNRCESRVFFIMNNIRKVFLVFCCLAFVVLCFLILNSGFFSRVFLGDIFVSKFVLVWFFVFIVMRLFSDMQIMFLTSFGYNFDALCNTLIQVVISLPLMIFGARMYGLIGILLALSIGCAFTGFFTLAWTVNRALSNVHRY